METQPENSKQFSVPSSKFNKHGELRNVFLLVEDQHLDVLNLALKIKDRKKKA